MSCVEAGKMFSGVDQKDLRCNSLPICWSEQLTAVGLMEDASR
jgi:hypothetical protein